MVSASSKVDGAHALTNFSFQPSSASGSASSFAQQLATAVEGYLSQSNSGAQMDIKISEVSGRGSNGSQFLVTVTPGGSRGSNPAPVTPLPASNIPTMLGMGPVAGTAPVTQARNPQPVAAAPMTEADAYWAQQPAAVQVLRNMPEGDAKDHLALNLANQGYAIDTQIMVWGWDPQMTMTVRENQGYSWVPSFGQSNITVGPGLSDPFEAGNYNPASPPSGSIQVSTAFAKGMIQNPLVTADVDG
jgi:hypothetical protein